ncbi:helix-turn-helix domain-containing protein [Armatimonas sp.]|uniref:helix-turn-helix domain-containing protein n=1 Tax=Armatimonas sp. TaxID=1872638 RepID=UPI00286CBBEA|nr:helix-turn-helix domain-containing protein [Armatimonas sp.]
MEDWLTIKEAAEILKLSEHTVRDQVRLGKIPATKLGHRTVRIRRAEVEALLPRAESPSVRPIRLDRVGIASWLLSVVDSGESTEGKLGRIRAFALGLGAE